MAKSGGKGGEFSKSRDVNKGVSRSKGQGPNQGISGSARKAPPFNGSNVYGIVSRPNGASPGGSAYGAARGNSVTGGGSIRSGKNPTAPKRAGRRGGR